jgi:hypothetical protein
VEVARIELASKGTSEGRTTCVVFIYGQKTRLSTFVKIANLRDFFTRYY